MQTNKAPEAQDFDVKPGDIYSLGDRHRIMCGDATNKEDVKRLFNGCKPTLVVTSPPYAKQRDYDRPIACWDSMMLGALDGHDFADDVQMLINLGVVHIKNEWSPYWYPWTQAMRSSKWRIHAQYPWDKTTPAPGHFGARLLPSHEFIFHINKVSINANKWVQSTTGGRRRSGRDISCKKGIRRDREPSIRSMVRVPLSVIRVKPVTGHTGESTSHVAQMPIALAQFLILTWKKQNCLIYDCFAGSGTTLHAAEQEEVTGLAMEISPAYTTIALARWAKAYPEQPIIKLAVAP